MRFGGDQPQGEPLTDRRQAAREAAHDAVGEPVLSTRVAIEAAIETATRVKITTEILRAGALKYPVVEEIVKAAFRAAGFEVEE